MTRASRSTMAESSVRRSARAPEGERVPRSQARTVVSFAPVARAMSAAERWPSAWMRVASAANAVVMDPIVAQNARETPGEPYFAYGTTQRGFPHHRGLAALLGEPAGRFRTVAPHAIVVPRRAGCGNPGCQFVHRMAALVPGGDLHAEGDGFLVGEAGLAELDALETRGPYVRARVEVVAPDGTRYEAHAFAAA